jgi:hypothetical protein
MLADVDAAIAEAGTGNTGGAITVRSVLSYAGVVADGVNDDTVGLQAALDDVIGNPGKGLFWPDANYSLTAALLFGRDDEKDIVGVHMYGESRGGAIITQKANNTPIFSVKGRFIHSCLIEKFTFQYANMQTGSTASAVFYCDMDGDDSSFYNNSFRDINANNFYYFMNAPLTLWWGNHYEECWFGDFAGGVNTIKRAAGEPNCRFSRLYISCQSAVETLFVHEAMTAQYDNIEVNSANKGVGMLYDGSSGTHVIGHWALEGAYYAQDKKLFEVPNGVLLADYIYTETLHVETGVTATIFSCEGARSFMDIKFFSIRGIDDANTGTIWVAQCGGPRKIRFRECIVPWATNVILTDCGASDAAEYVTVDSWNDLGRTQYAADANLTLSHDSPATILFEAITAAARTVTLPQGGNVKGTQLFTGRRFRIIKNNSSTSTTANLAITVKSAEGATLGTLAAGKRTVIEVVWHRNGGSTPGGWSVVDLHTF